MKPRAQRNILWFKEVRKKDGKLVGGKNASLGEMYSLLTKKGVNVPNGFALTAHAFKYFLRANNIDRKLRQLFREFDPNSLKSLQYTGREARKLIMQSEFPADLEQGIVRCYRRLSRRYGLDQADVAVRSSATAEDLKTASFAGQMETYLNVRGEEQLLKAVKRCIASLFTDRAIAYREEKGFAHMKVQLSVGVQKMVRSDKASSGVMFTLDTQTGFENVVLVNSIYGVGEMIVQGKITPDLFYVFKPTLDDKKYNPVIVKKLGRNNKKYVYGKQGGLKEVPVPATQQDRFSLDDAEVKQLAQWAVKIQQHYKNHQDIEWAKDGETGKLFIVQARPETVHATKRGHEYVEYHIAGSPDVAIDGIAIGDKIGQGKVRVIPSVANINDFQPGEVLVTRMTDPDWVPIMKQAAAIVTDEGGKTAHAAIVSRELGIPCIVGTNNASKRLKTGDTVTIDCTEGLKGKVYRGIVPFTEKRYNLKKLPKLKTKIMVNSGVPGTAFKTSFLPHRGVGLAREEFIIAEEIKIHPLALYYYKTLKDPRAKKKIAALTRGYTDKRAFYVEKLAEGIAHIVAAYWPEEVIVRFSDFRTNEYRSLIGGHLYEGEERNPMIGFRGASRYLDTQYQPAFEMEIEAIRRVWDYFGLRNMSVMVPFCRTIEEAESTLKLLKKYKLVSGVKATQRSKSDPRVYMMCEVPSNVVLADDFLNIFDGMSIGSNDLTQLTLGLDRDNEDIAHVGDERNAAVREMMRQTIRACRKRKKYCGICGQAPSDFPEIAKFLVEEGIESISLNSDTVIKTIMSLKNVKRKRR